MGEVIQYIIDNEEYVIEGNNNDGDYIIIDNDKVIRKNCLKFVLNTDCGRVLYKFYNKFVQSIENLSVRGKIGSHISDWLSNPDKAVKEVH